ncbi:MAG TPA: FliA/WhiG family RNA polymerase sigma factor [bacterium]|jgi:RNA polymerase sigma factor for flagellar operon FliA|nr:FliA/WhiG family RNA polymerase sigma factor [bacterium]
MNISEAWHRYKNNQDQAAWELLVETYASLVKHVAGRLSLTLPDHVEYDDLVASGVFGLLTAIERFDPQRQIKFETFATSRIRGAILDSLRATDWAPRSLRRRERDLARAYGSLKQRLGRPATAKEVGNELGIDKNELHDLERQINQASLLSLDAPLQATAAGEQVSLGMQTPADKGDPAQALEEEEKRRLLATAVTALPEREQLVVSLYYYDDLNIKEIAQILGVSESRVSQLHTRALLRLRGDLVSYQEELGLAERSSARIKYAARRVK